MYTVMWVCVPSVGANEGVPQGEYPADSDKVHKHYCIIILGIGTNMGTVCGMGMGLWKNWYM